MRPGFHPDARVFARRTAGAQAPHSACYAASGVRLAAAREELGAAEERWLELEIAREALDG